MATVYYQSTTSFICGGQYAAIVNHWKADDAGLTGNPFLDAENLIASLADDSAGPGAGWATRLAELLADECFVSAIRARKVSGGGGPTAVRLFTPIEFPGSFGGDLGAYQTAGSVNWACASGDARQGRNRIPGVSEDALIDNRFQTNYQGGIVALVDEVLAGFQESATLWNMVIRTVIAGAPPTIDFEDVIGGYLAPTPGHIKTRRVPV